MKSFSIRVQDIGKLARHICFDRNMSDEVQIFHNLYKEMIKIEKLKQKFQ